MPDNDPRDAPEVEIIRQTIRTTRRGVSCDCGKRMPPRTRYRDTVAKVDGTLTLSRLCVECPHGGTV